MSAVTPYKLDNGKVVRIPNAEIQKSMALLKLTRDEAIQMWLEDEGYEVNEEQEALCQKAKDNRITATIHKAKAEYKPKTQKERVQKEQPIKEEIIRTVAEVLATIGATEVNIENKAKLITFIGKDGEPYAIDLKWERNKSKQRKGEGAK